MRITTKLRYGIRFLRRIAYHYGTPKLLSISRIAEDEKISLKYLEHIILAFSRSGLIKGNRGKGGGYSLMKDPALISIYEIAEALEESLEFTHCIQDNQKCSRNPHCASHQLWLDLYDNYCTFLKSRTLSQLLESEKECDSE